MKVVLVLGAPFTRLKSRKVSSSDNSLKDLCTSMTVVMAQSLQKDYKLYVHACKPPMWRSVFVIFIPPSVLAGSCSVWCVGGWVLIWASVCLVHLSTPTTVQPSQQIFLPFTYIRQPRETRQVSPPLRLKPHSS